ncbi:hypothetical protein GQ464_016625 [Rhodocaloribacter litoris]|uniref:hypothetical protein n=1 Tax=Rhodocaloribacter litoris TaxID=2558931 RepID=UPI001421B471|nr:hypothetical protein [Rhodocaloribacter litoris]QXD15012.1 hypothetical protein GQ464_016625 [Rhodocaloribacter litoris]GIV62196.1 MAG: hypothetical protein KatS3mg044_1062 [Rhodothermaceae bacterium]
MTGLSLEQFLSAGSDFEQAQYRILGQLKRIRQAFSRNIIYPYLGDLIHLYQTLQTVQGRLDDLRQALPGEIKGIDLETRRLIYERPDAERGHLALVEDLITWALPLIQDAIEEGRTIFEFVEENLHLEEVGLVPSYVEEGYVIVPDRPARRLHILQYNLSIFTQADERYRSLRTTHVKTIDLAGIEPAPQGIKLALLAERPDLPNPATFFVESTLDFPYEPTLLPVAKRKLIRHLFEPGGKA